MSPSGIDRPQATPRRRRLVFFVLCVNGIEPGWLTWRVLLIYVDGIEPVREVFAR